MREILLLCLITLGHSSPTPQYSGQTQELSNTDLDTIKDIFGTGGTGDDGYGKTNSGNSGKQTGKLNDVEVAVQVVKNEDGYVAPDDYQPQSEKQTHAQTSIDNVFPKCEDYTKTQGYECVPYYQCDNGTIVTDGAGLIDIRNGFGILTPEDSKCEGFLDVCCKDPDFKAPPPEPVKKHVPQCGQRHINGLGVRIQGFDEGESQFGEWPHMCAILTEEAVSEEIKSKGDGYGEQLQEKETGTVNLYQCGGSLIAPDVILTAAHCVDKLRNNPSNMKVRCGEWDTQSQSEPREHADRYVQAIDVHPAFNSKNLANDFAVLLLEGPFELQAHIDTVCLPRLNEKFDSETCFATGWGKDKFGAAGVYQVVLKEIDLPVVNNYDCQEKLRTTRLGQKFKLDESFICAGGQGYKDTCKGDGGSPLVCPSKYDHNTYVQTGIVAWGIGCGETNVPGVYASVSEGLCWIDYAMSCRSNQPYNGTPNPSYWNYNCNYWWSELRQSLDAQVYAGNNPAPNLGGRKLVEARVNGVKAQEQLDYYNKCNVAWPVPNEGGGDISDFARDPEPLTDGTSQEQQVDPYPTAPITDGTKTGDQKGGPY